MSIHSKLLKWSEETWLLWGIACPKGTMAKQPVSLRSPLGVHQCHPLGERFSESLSTLPGICHCQHAPLDSLDLPFSLFFPPKWGKQSLLKIKNEKSVFWDYTVLECQFETLWVFWQGVEFLPLDICSVTFVLLHCLQTRSVFIPSVGAWWVFSLKTLSFHKKIVNN